MASEQELAFATGVLPAVAAGGANAKRAAAPPAQWSPAPDSLPMDEYCAARNQHLTGEIKLSLTMTVFSVASIDTVGQTFSCEFILVAQTLNANELRTVHGDAVTPGTFEPRIKFMNKLEESKWRLTAKMLPSGEVRYKYAVAGCFAETFELGNFPFDVQELQIIVGTAIPTANKETGQRVISFLPDGLSGHSSRVHLSHFCLSNVFSLEACMRVHTTATKPSESPSGKVRPETRFCMAVRRYSSYYLLNLIFPLFLISGISLCSFGVGRQELGDRLSVSTTMMLTAVAFKLIINADLPKLSYLTFIDTVSLANFVFVTLVVVQNTLAAQWSFEGADAVDLICAMSFSAVLAVSAVWTSVSAAMIQRAESARLRPFQRDASGAVLPPLPPSTGCHRCWRCLCCALTAGAAPLPSARGTGSSRRNRVSPGVTY